MPHYRPPGPRNPMVLASLIPPIADAEPALHVGSFPFTAGKFVRSLRSDDAEVVSTSCVDFVGVANKIIVPHTFLDAVGPLLDVLARRDDGSFRCKDEGFDVHVRAKAIVTLMCLMGCVEGVARRMIDMGVTGRLLRAARDEAEMETEKMREETNNALIQPPLVRTLLPRARLGSGLDVVALECLRALAADDAHARSMIEDDTRDDLLRFLLPRCVHGDVEYAPNSPSCPVRVAELSCDVASSLAACRTEPLLFQRTFHAAAGVTVFARALVAAPNDRVRMHALLALGVLAATPEKHEELVRVPLAPTAIHAATTSEKVEVRGLARDVWELLSCDKRVERFLNNALRTEKERERMEKAADGGGKEEGKEEGEEEESNSPS